MEWKEQLGGAYTPTPFRRRRAWNSVSFRTPGDKLGNGLITDIVINRVKRPHAYWSARSPPYSVPASGGLLAAQVMPRPTVFSLRLLLYVYFLLSVACLAYLRHVATCRAARDGLHSDDTFTSSSVGAAWCVCVCGGPDDAPMGRADARREWKRVCMVQGSDDFCGSATRSGALRHLRRPALLIYG